MSSNKSDLTKPGIEDLHERVGSKFVLVGVAAKRARELTDYFSQTGAGSVVPPQVRSASSKPLSIALDEICDGKIVVLETGQSVNTSDSHEQD